jgi:lipopolysaccharide transport system ATP-binding protein
MLSVMALAFHDVNLGPLQQFSVSAPDGALVGVIGESGSGVRELMQLAARENAVVLDHTLDAQDAIERGRSASRLEEQRRKGATVLIASHDEALLSWICDEIWWLDRGRLAMKGDPREVLAAYRRHVARRLREMGEGQPVKMDPTLRRGDGRAELLSVETIGENGAPALVWRSGERVAVRVRVRFHNDVDDPVIGIMIRTRIGFEVYGTNTELENVKVGPCQAGEEREATFSFRCELCAQDYTVTAASHDPDGVWHDWLEDAVAFSVTDTRYTAGVANLRAQVSVGNTK